jgi:hypothetical protein
MKSSDKSISDLSGEPFAPSIADLPFGSDPDSWNIEDSGNVGIQLFGNAVQVWTVMQNRSGVTVAEAAAAFNCTPRMVRAAVDEHAWMDACGPDDDFTKQTIEHEGE